MKKEMLSITIPFYVSNIAVRTNSTNEPTIPLLQTIENLRIFWQLGAHLYKMIIVHKETPKNRSMLG